ncbi:unnamed protein product [Allacma fusca]|uniref:Glycoprotein-N-acetylgalactosamine 3-beta-galactosyltransferase 1 n=1 Tax=Allacma fusca TaxID=39272 RepID=A0A8J2LW12_9HEXA|nr:unnamed protein product [Allacma fusca]
MWDLYRFPNTRVWEYAGTPPVASSKPGNATSNSEIQINYTIALKLNQEVRIICWIMTRPVNFTTKLEAVKKTWGKRCTKLLFFSSVTNAENADFERTKSYMSGGAGYVLSKESLIRFATISLHDYSHCYDGHGGPEDWQIGTCLQAVGVQAMDSRDRIERLDRFMPLDPIFLVNMKNKTQLSWYFDRSYYPHGWGLECEMSQMEMFIPEVKTFSDG